MPDDLNGTGSVSAAGTADPAQGSSSTDLTDYKSKYVGLNSAHSKLLDQMKDLQGKLAAQSAEHETELVQLKQQMKPASQRERDLETQLATLTAERNDFKTKAEKYETAASARSVIAEKYKALLEDWDDGILRERTSFADDAAFEAYLAKAAGKKPAATEQSADKGTEVPPPVEGLQQTRRTVLDEPQNTLLDQPRPKSLSLLGATPPVPTVGKDARTTKRTLQEIQNEMWGLNTRTPEGKKKFDALTAELDQVLG